MSKYFSFLKKKRHSLTSADDGNGVDGPDKIARKSKKRQPKKSRIHDRYSIQGIEDLVDRRDDEDPSPTTRATGRGGATTILTGAKSTSDLGTVSDDDSLLANLSDVGADIIPPSRLPAVIVVISKPRSPAPRRRLLSSDSSDSFDDTDSKSANSEDRGLLGPYRSIGDESVEEEENAPLIFDDDIDDLMDEAFEDLTQQETKDEDEDDLVPRSISDGHFDIVHSVVEEIEFEFERVQESEMVDEEEEEEAVDDPPMMPICDSRPFLPSQSPERCSSPPPSQPPDSPQAGRPVATDQVYELAHNLVSQSMIDAMLRTAIKDESPLLRPQEVEAVVVDLPVASEEPPITSDASSVLTGDTSSSYMGTNGPNSLESDRKSPPTTQSPPCEFCQSDDVDSCDCCRFDKSEMTVHESVEVVVESVVDPRMVDSCDCTDLIDLTTLEDPAEAEVPFEEDIHPECSEVPLPLDSSSSVDAADPPGLYCRPDLMSCSSVTTSSEMEDEFDSAKEELSDDDEEEEEEEELDTKTVDLLNNLNECHTTSKFIDNPVATERYRGGSLNKRTSKMNSTKNSHVNDFPTESTSGCELSPHESSHTTTPSPSPTTAPATAMDNVFIVNNVPEERPVLEVPRVAVEATGDKSTGSKKLSVLEDNFLLQSVNSEFDEAEARLAQRRAARAEARELRLRELEKQQQEQENEEEQQYAANSSPSIGLVPESPVRASSTGRSSVGRSSVTKSDGSFSRRSSEESDNDPREVKAELKELDEKFRKAMITNAQLDNEKSTLAYEVEFLKDRYSDLEETHLQLTKEHKKKRCENEQLRKLTSNLQEEVKAVRKILLERDALIQEFGLVVIGEENGEQDDNDPDYDAEMEDDTCYNLSPRKIAIKKALLTQEASELLSKGAAKGSLDVRLKKYAEEKNDLEDEVRRIRLELEEQYNMRRKENGLDYEKQKEASKSINEYKFRVQKAEAEVSSLQANVARLDSLTARYKASTEELEISEEELKAEKRRLQRELRDTQNLLEEIELKNSLMEKRFNKMRNAKSMLLKDLSQEPA